MIWLRVLVRDDLAQEGVEVAKGLNLAPQFLGLGLVVLQQLGEALDCGVENGVHRLMVLGALPPARLEIHLAEAVDLPGKVEPG